MCNSEFWRQTKKGDQIKQEQMEIGSTGSAITFGRTWPDKNSQIPDVVFTLVKIFLG